MPSCTRLALATFLASLLSLHALAADLIGAPRIIDGDTITIGTTHIRPYGIDAPEHNQLCQRGGDIWACGEDAANALRRKIRD